MKKAWLLKGIAEETRQAIKKQAHAYGCTISQLLEQTFTELTQVTGKIEPKYSWLLHGIRSSTKHGLKAQASKAGLSIADYLSVLVQKAGKDEAKEDDIIEQITAIIKGQ